MSLQILTETTPKDIVLSEVWPNHQSEIIERAIVLTVAYADVFDYPLTIREIHRYLIGVQTSLETVSNALLARQRTDRFLAYRQGYYTLQGREAIVETRQRRAAIAAKLWPKARFYGNLIALLPFTRMVAVTGALAMDNTDSDADIDFMIVTEPGRLWLCRALAILLVRWAALHYDTVCPNLFLSEQALYYHQQDLYTAHEMVQMIPIAVHKVYRHMMTINAWTLNFLPNAQDNGEVQMEPQHNLLVRKTGNYTEKFMRAPWIDRLERWEMTRKIRKFKRPNNRSNEANFSADWCRGYFNAHEQRSLLAFDERVSTIEADWSS